MPRPSPLLLAVRRELAALGDPERAKGAQAYMKSAMLFHGVGAVPLRAVCRALFGPLELRDAASFRREVLGFFRGAAFREEMYAAVELARWKRFEPFRDLDALPVFEEIVVTGAWWDVVDPVASHLLGGLLRKESRAVRGTDPTSPAASRRGGLRRRSGTAEKKSPGPKAGAKRNAGRGSPRGRF